MTKDASFALMGKGDALRLTGKHQEALMVYNSLNPKDPSTLMRKILCYLEMN